MNKKLIKITGICVLIAAALITAAVAEAFEEIFVSDNSSSPQDSKDDIAHDTEYEIRPYFDEACMKRFNEIAGASDMESDRSITRYYYFLNTEGCERIVVFNGGMSHDKTVGVAMPLPRLNKKLQKLVSIILQNCKKPHP